VEATDANPAGGRETITFGIGGEAGRTTVSVLAEHGSPPYQLAVIWHWTVHRSRFSRLVNRLRSVRRQKWARPHHSVSAVRTRWSPFLGLEATRSRAWRVRLLEWRHDIGHVIDLAAARPVSTERIAYLGVTGASTAVPLLVIAHFRAAILPQASVSCTIYRKPTR
jgi:hypothetical protein